VGSCKVSFNSEKMTEGPTARLRALQIEDEFKGKEVKDVLVRSKKVYVDPKCMVGKRLEKATSFGKNILLYIGNYLIRIHLMMYGSIRFEKDYSKPFRQVRLALFFKDKNLVIYNAPIVEIGLKGEIEEKLIRSYGIDPLTNWDKEKLKELLVGEKERKIGDLLLDQRIFNGIGNILRNEILFRARVNPERLVKDLDEREIEAIADFTKELCYRFLELKRRGKGIKNMLLVYNKKKCPICGGGLKFYRQQPNSRKTFVCPNCQR